MKIQEIDSFEKLALSLDIKTGHLRRLLFEERDQFYTEIDIPKKNGEPRKIFVPNDKILYLQKRVNEILIDSFNPHFRAFGFVKGRNTVQNAQLHLRKKYLLNIDLKDFFPSVSSGRVRSMFINYFKLNPEIASSLTNLCCHPSGFLPQGAPTSPTITNILCKTLDKNLFNFAQKTGHRVTYSRYADDITFSSNNPFDEKLVSIRNETIVLGFELQEIIKKNGFQINDDKTRIQKNNQHQEVTGVIVNQKLNIDRRFIRKIRAMLFSIESNLMDLSIPKKKFEDSNYKGSSIIDLFKVLKGMIEYVGMVKGKNDPVFLTLSLRYNQLIKTELFGPVSIIKLDSKFIDYEYYTCVIPSTIHNLYAEDFVDYDYGQGTGFILKNVGIVSNYHVFEFIIDALLEGYKPLDDKYFVEVRFGSKQETKIKLKIKEYSKELDLVVLEPKDKSILDFGFDIENRVPNQNQEINLIGYPDFHEGDQLKVEKGDYLRTTNVNNIKNYEISSTIFNGNSGGPVVNEYHKVIGVATEGLGGNLNRVVPISYLSQLTEIEYTTMKKK